MPVPSKESERSWEISNTRKKLNRTLHATTCERGKCTAEVRHAPWWAHAHGTEKTSLAVDSGPPDAVQNPRRSDRDGQRRCGIFPAEAERMRCVLGGCFQNGDLRRRIAVRWRGVCPQWLILPGLQLAAAGLLGRVGSACLRRSGTERAAGRRHFTRAAGAVGCGATIVVFGSAAAPVTGSAQRLRHDLCEQCRTCRR